VVRASADGGVAAVVAADHLCYATSSAFVKDKTEKFWGIAVAPDGALVANGRPNGRVELRDPRSLEVKRVLDGMQAPAIALAFSPDGRFLVGADDTTRARMWNLETGAATEVQGLAKITHLAWRPDGSGFVAVELTRAFAMFDVADPTSPVFDLRPDGFETRYFIDGTWVDDHILAIAVEDRGVLLAEWAPPSHEERAAAKPVAKVATPAATPLAKQKPVPKKLTSKKPASKPVAKKKAAATKSLPKKSPAKKTPRGSKSSSKRRT
jgi:hypothetical protein